jgi:iron(III) transport system ATP-binding protein
MRGLGVTVDGLGAAYDADAVLHDVTLHVEPGEIVAMLGPSGCGKTTLLRCIAGLETPTAGRIVIDDRDVTSGRGVPAEKRRVGMVFQEGALFPHRTVFDNVGYGVRRGDQRRERGAASLRLVGLTDMADRMPGTLSGGEQQRVALARALAPEPGVMLLDEPFSSLDAGLRWQLRGEVRRLLKAIGVTTILVTHDQEEALTFGDRVAVMRHGRVEQVGSPEDVYGRPASSWVARFVGEANLLAAAFTADGAVTAIGTLPAAITEGEGTVLCRPQQLGLAAGGDATVVATSYFGRDTRYEVDVPVHGALVVRTPDPPSHAPGDHVTVRFVGAVAHAWAAKSCHPRVCRGDVPQQTLGQQETLG